MFVNVYFNNVASTRLIFFFLSETRLHIIVFYFRSYHKNLNEYIFDYVYFVKLEGSIYIRNEKY